MGALTYTAVDYQAQLLDLCPHGPLWPRDSDLPMSQFLGALSPTYARLCERDANLLTDAFPVAPVELLPEWELTLGLPDPCAGPSPTIQQRQQQVAARFVAAGGQSADYFIAVAAALGYAITITTFAPSRFGRPFGLPFGGAAWASAWQVNAPSFNIQYFPFGRGAFGQPFAVWGNTVLQCEMQRLAPAHTVLMFSYGGVLGFMYNDSGVLATSGTAGFQVGPDGLPDGGLYLNGDTNGGVISATAGATLNPSAPTIYFYAVTPQSLIGINAGDLKWTAPAPGSQILWVPGGAAGGDIWIA